VSGNFITLKPWLITRVFLQGCLAFSIPDEVAAHKRYQPGKCLVRDIQGMSKKNPCLMIMNCTITLFISPVQLRPSPVYPALQVQLYEPWMLTQSALAWHLCVAEVHSLTSDIKKNMSFSHMSTFFVSFLVFCYLVWSWELLLSCDLVRNWE